MEKCLIDNKICSIQFRRCKTCKLDNCRESIKILDKQQKKESDRKLKRIIEQLPEQCKNCAFLEIIDITKQTVHCPYMLKNCILKEELLC